MTKTSPYIRFLALLIPFFGLVSCSEEPVGEPDQWQGPKIRVMRPNAQEAVPLDSTTESLLPTDEVWVLKPSTDDNSLAAGDPSVAGIEVTTQCSSEAQGSRTLNQKIASRSHLAILDLLPWETLPSISPAPATERMAKCEFRLRFENSRGSTRTRRIGPVLVDLEVPTGSIALSGFEKTLENRPLISASDRNMYAKVPAGGAVALRCSRDTAVASGVNSDFPLSILFETLEKNRGPVAQNLSNPSPRQFCRVYHRDSDLKTESSTHFILDSLKPNLELELVADLANQLHDHYSFSFQLMTLKISNSSSGPVSYRIPRLLTHTWIKFILNNGFNYYASYDRPATARTEVTTAGQVNRWQAGDFEFITLDSGSQVEYRFFAEISHVCGSSNEFVGLDFHPPISRDRLLYLERAAAPILPGQESSFLTAYAEYPQAQGALLTEHPKRLNYFVRWSRSSYAPGPMGELPIGDSCWR